MRTRECIRDSRVGRTAGTVDLGAGIGLNLEVLRAFGVVDALESNPIGLAQLAGNPHVRDVFAHALPRPLERRYDVIGAFDVIEHLADDDEAVAEGRG